ncbi:MAG: CocE/NonD family hydrolase, partial [Candidatus Promineifilaceae bacterium]
PYGRSRTALAGFFKQILMQQYAKRGYHVILQDTRGRYASSGEFEPYVNEPDDGQTTINWIVRQPWSDGQIGMTGQSYVGFVSYAAAARDEHKHLKALFPIITQSRLGSLPEHAYPLDLALRWLFLLDAQSDDMPFAERMRRLIDVKYQNSILAKGFETLPLADTGQAIFSRNDPILDTWFSHPAEDDPYWDKLDHRAVVKDAPPAHFVAGWYDLFIEGQLEDYQVQVQAGKNPYLTIGAWTHLDPGNQSSTLGASLRWFDKHLKGIDNLRAKPVRMLLMGANEWREYEQWPPEATDTTYYLQGNGVKDGTLSRYSAPPNNPPSCYNYDPNNPTPNAGGPLLSVDAGPVDNRALEARKDVLTFTTPVLQSDCDVIGHPKVTLFVRSSAVSADFFGRICDVDPSGKSTNICDALYRIKPQRDQADANGGYKLTFDLSPIGYRFKAGHQIRLQISSGAFPRFQRNLGLDGDFMFETDMVVADQTVYHDPTQPSSVTLPIAASR